MIHGTYSTYHNHKCRCDKCKAAAAGYARARYQRNRPVPFDRDAIADLLHELAPDGLTDDCPARRAA